jgi:hypothetical protein
VILDEDMPGLLMSFLRASERPNAAWRHVKVGSEGATGLCWLTML